MTITAALSPRPLNEGQFLRAVYAAGRRLALGLILLALLPSPSWADKPEWAGQGKRQDQKKEAKEGKKAKEGRYDGAVRAGTSVQINIGGYFAEPQRQAVYQVYGADFQAGRCPPGLARKNNGCRPPGQARGYAVGQRLPGSLVFHDVAPSVVVRIGLPPAGHRYVRVAADILLIAIGTGMVIDAIEDIGR